MDRMQAEQVATTQVDPGESVLWAGSPSRGAMALQAIPLTLFGIPFAGFAALWITMASRSLGHGFRGPGPMAFFPLFGVPFLVVGLGMLTAPLWAFLGAGATVYAVTDRRILIITGAPRRTVLTYNRAEIGDLVRTEGADGSGSLTFGWSVTSSSNGLVRRTRIGFIGIPEVRHVEQLIRDQLQAKAA